jgi:hypothetical protein
MSVVDIYGDLASAFAVRASRDAPAHLNLTSTHHRQRHPHSTNLSQQPCVTLPSHTSSSPSLPCGIAPAMSPAHPRSDAGTCRAAVTAHSGCFVYCSAFATFHVSFNTIIFYPSPHAHIARARLVNLQHGLPLLRPPSGAPSHSLRVLTVSHRKS